MTAPLFWFRRDLRLHDNPALLHALHLGGGSAAAVFVVEPALLARVGPSRVNYLRATVAALSTSMGGALSIVRGDPAEQLKRLASQLGAHLVVATRDFSPRGRARDEAVASALAAVGVELRLLDSPYLVAPGTVLAAAGTPYRVFTPFYRAWSTYPVPSPLPAPTRAFLGPFTSPGDPWAVEFVTPALFEGLPDEPAALPEEIGEEGAAALVASFRDRVANYRDDRDVPARDATSRLSAHLRFGTVHPRQLVAAVDGLDGGADFVRQLAWREFYADVLFHQPASIWRALQPVFEHLEVDHDAAARDRFGRWARGETGFPLVDAGMRQLLAEGYQHNRVRMVCASFLVKHLHLDWRWGAQWYLWRLFDADVANNQHGWQWVAGSGTDAAPFHRIFNPVRQSERFDPDGTYVRHYVAELAGVEPPACWSPGAGGGLLAAGYPSAMIDLDVERADALSRVARLKEWR